MKKLIIASSVVIVLSLVAITYALTRNTEIPVGSSVTWKDGTGTSITERVELARDKEGNPIMGYKLRVMDDRAPNGSYVVGIPEKYVLGVK